MTRSRNTAPPPRPRDRLDLRGPAAMGLVLFACAGVAAGALATLTSSDQGVSVKGRIVADTRSIAIESARGGVAGRVHVAAGAEVEAGDLLVSLDTKALDAEIVALRAAADATHKRLDRIREKALGLDVRSADASAKKSLARQIAEVESESIDLKARIAVAEQEIADSSIRAPAPGRIAGLKLSGDAADIESGAVIAELTPRANGPSIALAEPTAAARAGLKQGAAVLVWPASPKAGALIPRLARIVHAGPERGAARNADTALTLVLDLAATAGDWRPDLAEGTHARVMAVARQRSLLDTVLDPVIETVNRTRRTPRAKEPT